MPFYLPDSSGENRTTMHKCYTFLVLMVLVLPSLGLTRWVYSVNSSNSVIVKGDG